MTDKLLGYALAVSVGLHLVVLVAVGKTSAARPIELDELKLVRVEMVNALDEPKPALQEVEPKPSTSEPKPVVLPPPEKIRTAPPPKPVPRKDPRKQPRPVAPKPPDTASNKPPGDPGGPVNPGSTSERGEDLGPGGKTPVGWVPGSPDGVGVGSGSGPGTGKPEPVKDAAPGPGKEPAPPPPPPPDLDVSVCRESGMLPGPNCERTAVRSFNPGTEPRSRCAVCKPKHVSTLADRSVPELISGKKRPEYPELARARGIEGSVTVEYTIDTKGNVIGVKTTKSSGSAELDRAALDTVKSRKYKPAVQGGIARNYRKRETFHFTLD